MCVICRSKKRLTAGHLITAKKLSVRFDEDNVFGQCAPCNFKHEHFPEIFTLWYLKMRQFNEYESLVRRSLIPHKFTRAELEEIVRKYQ